MNKIALRREVLTKVVAKANARNIALDAYSLEWIVNTLLADIACKFSESRIYRHMNSMLTRIKTEIRAG